MIKTLAAHIKEFKLMSFLTPICMIAEVIMEMRIPLIMASIIDNGIMKGDMNSIVADGVKMAVCAVIGLAAGAGGAIFGAKASTGFARNLRKAMYENIQTYSFSNIDKFSTASLITRLTTDVTNVQNAYQMLLRLTFRAPITIVVAMISSFQVNSELARIYLYAVIFLAVVLSIFMPIIGKRFGEVFKKYDDLNASVQENVSAIRVVKAYVREDHENEKFKKANQNIYKMFVRAESLTALNSPLMQGTVYTCILLISWLGAQLIVNTGGTEFTTGNLTTMLSYCMNILMSIMILSMIFVMVTMSAASARRIAEVLEEKSDLSNPENPETAIPDGSVKFENVSFAYGRDNKDESSFVLRNVNLDIRSGETVGIIGGTGSSKSTLVSLISRLYDVTEGAVYVGGKNVKSYDMEILRNSVAVVLQKNVLFSGTILENLRWGNKEASEEECIHACKLACADEFIEKMPDKYNTYIEQGGSNVSGGQKQRLCIARALLKKPKVLILDDSTSAVDTATDAKIRKAFAEEIPNTTKFIIAQRISSVQNADRIIVLDNGMVTAFDTHEKLLETSEIYRDVYESQTQGGGDFDENKPEGGINNG